MTWTATDERRMLYSQIGLRLIDEFTGEYPAFAIHVELEKQLGTGEWAAPFPPVDPEFTPSGNITFPGLGLNANASFAPDTPYRVRLSANECLPDYLRAADALYFTVRPYDHSTPPAVVPPLPQTVMLLPTVSYPFPGHVRVVRGVTTDAGSGNHIRYVEVTEGIRERVLSDERGAFALPLRWPDFTGPVTIDAVDHRTGRTDSLALTLPGDLLNSQTFQLT
jgi:hypothetical protein